MGTARESEQSARAMAAALACAARLGLDARDPIVLRDRYNLLVHLPGAGAVVRVATRTAEVRGPDWLAREVAVARHLDGAGLRNAIIAPLRHVDPGPHAQDGLTVTLWDYAHLVDRGTLDAAEAGRRLRRCHEALANFAPAGLRFPVLDEARVLARRAARAGELAADDLAHVEALADRLAGALDRAALPMQQVHGDAHEGNLLATADGPRWGDWEDTIAAPTEWDLACALGNARGPLGTGDDATALRLLGGYGDHDADALALLVDVRALQGVAWGLAVPPRTPDDPAPARRLAWLREHGPSTAGRTAEPTGANAPATRAGRRP